MYVFGLGSIVDAWTAKVDGNPWSAHAGSSACASYARQSLAGRALKATRPLYTAEERRRRDTSKWTLVQAILAPVQFLIFLVSLGLVLNYLVTGAGQEAATISIVLKTIALYVIMVTGAIWEREVFGRYLFAPSFFWEDAFSMLVLALHTAYLVALASGAVSVETLMLIALAAYASYLFNAGQFVIKLRMARRESAQARNATVSDMAAAR